MSVHVVPEIARDLHLLAVSCWCQPTTEDCGQPMVTHQHRDDRPTQWLLIEMDDSEPN